MAERADQIKDSEIREAVRKAYAGIVTLDEFGCTADGVCVNPEVVRTISKTIGYTEEELNQVPEGANLGLGCGNPTALASLEEGEVVLDLGSGAGFDCFISAHIVGETGKVIGIDMTPEMIEKARGNASEGDYRNVEFRLGEIENLPVDDASVDVVISNCVINLSPHKGRVFQEAFRVLKPGGRLAVSDIVLLEDIPDSLKGSIEAYVGCLSGAVMKDAYIEAITEAGFEGVRVIEETPFPAGSVFEAPVAEAFIQDLSIPSIELTAVSDAAVSVKVHAVKPAGTA